MKRIASTILVAISTLALYVGGCSDDADPPQSPQDDDPGEIETNLTDPAAVIEAHDRCWQEQNYQAYEALLDDTFEFYPLGEDVNDFPWLQGDNWGRTVELGLAFNMFDNNFSGGNGSADLIELDSTLQGTPEILDDGTIRMTATQVGRVMWTPTDGAAFDTRMKIDLVSRDGFLRIRRIEEIPRNLLRGSQASVEDVSWGNIKGLFK